MISNKFYILVLSLLLFSCSNNNKALQEQKARHQAETGGRINDAQKDTDSLFKDMQ